MLDREGGCPKSQFLLGRLMDDPLCVFIVSLSVR